MPLPEAVTAVEDWYRRRDLPPMIVLPRVLDRGSGPDPLEDLLAERVLGSPLWSRLRHDRGHRRYPREPL